MRISHVGSNGETVSRMLDAWARKAVDEILACFTDDAVCHPIPMQPLTGKAMIETGLRKLFSQVTVDHFETLHQLEQGDVVMNERLDHFIIDGKPVHLPVVGVFELESGRIRAWRDYFDAAMLVPR